jgi:Leucine-rich repeat (LRR) protein
VPKELGNLAALNTLSLNNNKLTRLPKDLGGDVHVESSSPIA